MSLSLSSNITIGNNMDWLTFIDKHAASIFPVLGTLSGVLISLIFSWLINRCEFRNQVKLKKIDLGIDFQKDKLIEPVLSFLESDLKLMTRIYQIGLNAEASQLKDQLDRHILDMSMVSARLGAYGNTTLSDKFDEFSRKRIEVGFLALEEHLKDIPQAHSKLKEAESLAADIIRMLKNTIESTRT